MSERNVTVEGISGDPAPQPRGQRPSTRRLVWRRLVRRPAALVGLIVFCFFLLLAVFGPYVAPYDYQAQDVKVRLQSPTVQHPFGTDQFGRDILSRIVVGSRNIFLLGGTGTLLAALIGTAIGLASGYAGGLADEVIMRLLDVLLSFPSLLLALVLLSSVGPSNLNLVLVVTILYVPMIARVVRSMVLDLKTKEFVEAARVRGERRSYVLFREILPNSLPLLVETSMRFSYSIFLVASLGFLGLGVQPPSPDWGLQINEARNFFAIAPWTLLFPAGTIALLVIATSLMSDGLRQVMLPRRGQELMGPAGMHAATTPARTTEAPGIAARPPVLEVEGLSIEYETETGILPAVRNVSLEVREHESFGIVGESGSGKSTLAMGAIRYLASNGRVTGGSVRLNGVELLDLSRKELRALWGSRIGVVYQSPLTALNPSILIGKQLAEVARLHLGMDRGAAMTRVTEMLAKVAMPDPEAVMRRYPHQLSGGMLQRCVIAMALMTNPALLIMDEPTTALDVTTQAVVLDLVAELKREFDSAIVYITHDLGVVTKICDRVGVMYAGEFMEQASLRELFQRPLHPYTLDLLGCVPHFDRSPEKRSLVTIPGSIPHLDELPPGCIFAPRCSFVRDACRAARPPLDPVGEGHSSACIRWRIVPTPAERLGAATEALTELRSCSGDGAPLVEVDDVKTYFKGPGEGFLPGRRRHRAIRAVDGVSLTVCEGQTLGVVGESGSGKTTVARAIVGLTPATEGEIRLHGRKLEPAAESRKRGVLKEIQMVFQNPDASLNPTRTVGDAISRPLVLLGGMGRTEAATRARELLEAVSLPAGYYDRLPNELSGGEKQRVAIARAFAAEPDLILCDEPISSLDVSVQGSLMNLLMKLQVEQRTSYVFISHDLSAVQHLSDTIAVVYVGRVMELGDAVTVLTPPFHPYTEALLSAVPVADPDVKQTPIRLRGNVPSAMDIPSGCRFHTRCPRFLGDICREHEPPWRHGEGSHRIYCHIPLDELVQLQAETLVLASTTEDA